jgi:hypothetical protein
LRVASQPTAAFGLIYEGVGKDRAEDYEFTADDFAAIYETRAASMAERRSRHSEP